MRRQKIYLSIAALAIYMAGPMAAARSAETIDPSGTWTWQSTFRDTTVKSTLKLKINDGRLTGSYRSDRSDSEAIIEEGKVDGDRISFQTTFKRNDRTFTIKYDGRISGDTIKGTREFHFGDDSRSSEWEAKRSVDVAAVLGTWTFTATLNNGRTRQATVKVTDDGGKLKGTYRGDSEEVEAESVEFSNGQLIIRVEQDRNDRKLKLTYRGEPDGDSIAGTVAYQIGDQNGSIDFTGERAK